MKKRFRSGINIARTRLFPGADVGSDHDMVMMTFQTCPKNSRKPTQPRIRFDLEKLNDPTVMSAFQATIGGRFAPPATLVDEDADLDSMVTHFNKAVTDTAAELLGKQRRKRKPWVTPEILDLYDQRRDLKKKRGGEPEGAKDYREIKRNIRTEMTMAKETWKQTQCQEVEACHRMNNSKKAYRLVKDLTTEKQGKPTTIQDKSGKCLTEENEILNRLAEYFSDLYNYEADGDPRVLDCPHIPDEEHHPFIREEVEVAVKALKMGKSAGVDNIPAKLVPQSLVITLPKKGNLQLCQNYRTIGFISHLSKAMLKIILKTPATSRRDHCRRASRFQSRKEHHRTNIQS